MPRTGWKVLQKNSRIHERLSRIRNIVNFDLNSALSFIYPLYERGLRFGFWRSPLSSQEKLWIFLAYVLKIVLLFKYSIRPGKFSEINIGVSIVKYALLPNWKPFSYGPFLSSAIGVSSTATLPPPPHGRSDP